MDEIVARHDAAGKEVLSDPIGLVGLIEPIRCLFVTEYVHEETAVRPQPIGDFADQRLPIGNVFEHFNGDDAIVLTVRLEIVHVSKVGGNRQNSVFGR